MYSSVYTHSVLPAMFCVRLVATVALNSTKPCVGSRRKVAEYCFNLNQEGRGIGLANKIRAYGLQDEGLDTVEANEHLGFKPDQRDYGIGVQILRELGVRSMRLLSNNPRKLVAIEGYGLSVTKWLPLEIPASASTRRYLTTKRDKLGHVLTGL